MSLVRLLVDDDELCACHAHVGGIVKFEIMAVEGMLNVRWVWWDSDRGSLIQVGIEAVYVAAVET